MNKAIRAIVGGLLLSVAALAAAQDYPTKPIRLVVPQPAGGPTDRPVAGPVTSADCAQCHRDQYDSWYRTYHRTMTRDASPENVKGDFANAAYEHQGITTRLTRDGDTFFMETVDPTWAELRAKGRTGGLPPRPVKLRVDRTVGSHWIQEYFHRAADGRFVRLPVLRIDEAVGQSRLPTQHAGRRIFAALSEQEEIGFFFQQLDLVDRAKAAAMLAGTPPIEVSATRPFSGLEYFRKYLNAECCNLSISAASMSSIRCSIGSYPTVASPHAST